MGEKNIFLESDLTKILVNVCEGLQLIHQANIVHLNLTPKNILLASNGRYKIGQLGFMKALYDRGNFSGIKKGD